MSDIKQIKVGDTTYDIKDETARERLDVAEVSIASGEEQYKEINNVFNSFSRYI